MFWIFIFVAMACAQNSSSVELSTVAPVALTGIEFSLEVEYKKKQNTKKQLLTSFQMLLPPLYNMNLWPSFVNYTIDVNDQGIWLPIANGTLDTQMMNSHDQFQRKISGVKTSSHGTQLLRASVGDLPIVYLKIFAIPAWISIFPPIATLILAIVLRQVIIALLVGVWVGVTFTHRYNVFTALLSTLGVYWVNAFGSGNHPAVILFTLCLEDLLELFKRVEEPWDWQQ